MIAQQISDGQQGFQPFSYPGIGACDTNRLQRWYLRQLLGSCNIRGGKLFHGRDCGWARRIAEADRVYFKRMAEAQEAGFGPCPSCEPWEPAG